MSYDTSHSRQNERYSNSHFFSRSVSRCSLPLERPVQFPAAALLPWSTERAAGSVAEAAERHPGGLHVPGAELEAVLELIQHAAAAGVDAGVV